MRVLITGGTGFIGRQLKTDLIALGHDVTAPTRTEMDITDEASVFSAVEAAQPDWIIHLAALTSGDEAEMVRANVEGTQNVINAARTVKVSAVVIAGTNAEYGDAPTPFLETTIPHPINAYGRTKLEATQHALEATDIPVAVLRFSNVYGEGGRSFIELFADAVRAGSTVRTSNTIIRDFVHVSDASRACIAAAEHIAACRGRVLNIASGETFTTQEITRQFSDISHIPLEVLVSSTPYVPKCADQESNAADNRLAAECIGWKPSTKLRDVLVTMSK